MKSSVIAEANPQIMSPWAFTVPQAAKQYTPHPNSKRTKRKQHLQETKAHKEKMKKDHLLERPGRTGCRAC